MELQDAEATVPVSDDEPNGLTPLLRPTSHGQAALADADAPPKSPLKRVKTEQEDHKEVEDPDARLEILLQRYFQKMSEEPSAWALQLQATLGPQLAQVNTQLGSMGERLEKVEQAQASGRLEGMEEQIASLMGQFEQVKRGHAEDRHLHRQLPPGIRIATPT